MLNLCISLLIFNSIRKLYVTKTDAKPATIQFYLSVERSNFGSKYRKSSTSVIDFDSINASTIFVTGSFYTVNTSSQLYFVSSSTTIILFYQFAYSYNNRSFRSLPFLLQNQQSESPAIPPFDSSSKHLKTKFVSICL